MITRILVADTGEARFYDLDSPTSPPRPVGELTNPLARQLDRDFKSDRPGRVFDHAASPGQRRGSVAHHSTGGEETPKRHEAHVFANHVVKALEAARVAGQFDQLVVIAGPHFIGLLRSEMPKPLSDTVVHEVVKDLVHEPVATLREYLPVDVLSARATFPH